MQDTARLLPWFVNGTLSDAQARQVASHLEQCATCRADADQLGSLRLHLRAPAQVEHAPHAGFQKLLARIDAAERNDAVAPAALRPARAGRGALQWLTAAVVVQALALGAIGGALLLRRPGVSATPDFRTLSTARPEAAALRVVFAPATTLAEVQDLLRANQLAVLAGPSDAGLFTLALRDPETASQTRLDALARLRADPRVRFAEPVGGDVRAQP
jgi:anti-sigma factor RsiW